jgi:hypothetical protein
MWAGFSNRPAGLKNRPTVKHLVAGSCHFCISDQTGSRFPRHFAFAPLTQIVADS